MTISYRYDQLFSLTTLGASLATFFIITVKLLKKATTKTPAVSIEFQTASSRIFFLRSRKVAVKLCKKKIETSRSLLELLSKMTNSFCINARKKSCTICLNIYTFNAPIQITRIFTQAINIKIEIAKNSSVCCMLTFHSNST